jgi:hypothetical protein
MIDEVSTVKPHYLEFLDRLFQLLFNQPKLPFGGIKTVIVGDICQMAAAFSSKFFFECDTLDEFYVLNLGSKITNERIKDRLLIQILNDIRLWNGDVDKLKLINQLLRGEIDPTVYDGEEDKFVDINNAKVRFGSAIPELDKQIAVQGEYEHTKDDLKKGQNIQYKYTERGPYNNRFKDCIQKNSAGELNVNLKDMRIMANISPEFNLDQEFRNRYDQDQHSPIFTSTVLVSEHLVAQKINEQVIRLNKLVRPADAFYTHNSENEDTEIGNCNAHSFSTGESEQRFNLVPKLEDIFVGATVLATIADKDKKISKNDQLTVTSINADSNRKIQNISVRKVKDGDIVEIYPKQEKQGKFLRTQFGIRFAYALTPFTCIGDTLPGNVIVDTIRMSSCKDGKIGNCGHLYTMGSRNGNREHVGWLFNMREDQLQPHFKVRTMETSHPSCFDENLVFDMSRVKKIKQFKHVPLTITNKDFVKPSACTASTSNEEVECQENGEGEDKRYGHETDDEDCLSDEEEADPNITTTLKTISMAAAQRTIDSLNHMGERRPEFLAFREKHAENDTATSIIVPIDQMVHDELTKIAGKYKEIDLTDITRDDADDKAVVVNHFGTYLVNFGMVSPFKQISLE